KGLSLAITTASIAPSLAKSSLARTASAGRVASLRSNDSNSLFHVVETASGKVQGVLNVGIKEFKGIPYGAPTGGKNRFMPPKKPTAWTGVRECFGHGQACPQTPANLRSEYGMMIQWDQQNGGMGE